MKELSMIRLGMQLIQLSTFSNMARNFAGIISTVMSALGVILCIWGGFNFAMSLEARDNNQRLQGAITFFSGILLMILPKIVSAVSGDSDMINENVSF